MPFLHKEEHNCLSPSYERISCGIKSETCAFLLGPFYVTLKEKKQHYHPMQMCAS